MHKKKYKYLILLLLSICIFGFGDSARATEKTSSAEILWGDHLPLVRAQLEAIDKEFADITIEAGFNEIYGREELDLQTRELCTITVLTVLNKTEELNLHLLAALRVGWTFEELREIMILCCIPAGWPSVINALQYLYLWCEQNNIAPDNPLDLRDDYYTADWYQIGYDKGVDLFGKRIWRKYLKKISSIDTDLANFTVINLIGKLLTRTLLDDRTRELCYVAACTALRDKLSLKMHIKGALRSGATRIEVKEAIFHAGSYAGQDTIIQGINIFKNRNKF